MSDFDFSTLITDRTQADIAAVSALIAKIQAGTATTEEKEQFNAAAMRGPYNYTDLNRVSAAVYYLDNVLQGYGYQTGVQKIVVPHEESGGGGTSRLPEGYTELEYIQSSGTQYIDTGFKPNQNTRVSVDMDLLAQSSYPMAVFGSRNGSTSAVDSFVLWAFSSTTFRTDLGSNTLSIAIPPVGRFSIDKDKAITTIGETAYSQSSANFQSNYNLSLFGQNDVDGIDTRMISARLYFGKIYDNDVLIRDYVPCINPSGKIGLYDMVTATFFGNAGTGVFTHNPLDHLPAAYTQLEYIALTGTQYINGVTLQPNFKIVFTAEITQTTSYYNIYDNNTASPMLWVDTNSKLEMNTQQSEKATVPLGTKTTIISEVTGDNNLLYVDGVLSLSFSKITGGPFAVTLFNRAGSQCFVGKVYLLEIYAGQKLSYQFIPCIDSSGAIGLYDLVGGLFYANAGTGTFVAGPEVTTPSQPSGPSVEYDDYTWYEPDVPTPTLMAAYLANVVAVYNALLSDPALPETMRKLTAEGANQIEQALIDVQQTIERIVAAFSRSNAFTFWSGNRPLPSAKSDLGRNWGELDAMETTWANWQVATWYLLLYGNLKAEGAIE